MNYFANLLSFYHPQAQVTAAEHELKEAESREISKKKLGKLKKKNSKAEQDEVCQLQNYLRFIIRVGQYPI
jgi:hypothetical protein